MPLTPRLPRRLAHRGVALLLGAGVVAGIVAGGAAAALAETDADGPPPSEAAVQAKLIVAPTESVLEPSQNRFEFAVRVDNSGEDAIPAGSLSLDLRPERLDSAAQLDEPFTGFGSRVVDAELGAVPADDEQSTTVTVRADEFPLTASDEPGVYLLRATLTPGEGAKGKGQESVVGTVPFVWRGASPQSGDGSEAKTQLGFIVPLVLPSSVRATPTPAQLDKAVPQFEALLDAAAKTRATVAIDPRIVASIRAYGDNASAQSRDFLKRLENMALPSFLLQFADADPAAQSAIGMTELLAPVNLEYLTRQGSFPAPDTGTDAAAGTDVSTEAGTDSGTAGDSAGADASTDAEAGAATDTGTGAAATADPEAEVAAEVAADGDPEAAPVPTLDELLAWPQEVRPVAWPAEGQVDTATIALLQSSGISDTVLRSDNATLEGGPRASLGTDEALIADAALGDEVRRALAATDDTDRLAAISTASARLAVTAGSPNSGMLIALDRGAVADAEDPAALIEQLSSPGWVEATAVQALPEGSATLRAASPLEERRELLRSAAGREADVDRLSVLLQHPGDLTGYQRARLMNLFATRYAGIGSDFTAVAKTYGEYDEQLKSGVQIVSTEHTQLVGTSTRVPVQLRNYLPFDAVVTAEATPISAALTVNERSFPDVAVTADGNARILVPVLSRVSAGESGLSIVVSDTVGELESDSKLLPLTIRSGIERIGVWVLGALAALLLVFGTLRSVRRRSRKRAAAALDSGADTAESGAGPPPAADAE